MFKSLGIQSLEIFWINICSVELTRALFSCQSKLNLVVKFSVTCPFTWSCGLYGQGLTHASPQMVQLGFSVDIPHFGMPTWIPRRTTVGCPYLAFVVEPMSCRYANPPWGFSPMWAAQDGLMWMPIFCPHWPYICQHVYWILFWFGAHILFFCFLCDFYFVLCCCGWIDAKTDMAF